MNRLSPIFGIVAAVAFTSATTGEARSLEQGQVVRSTGGTHAAVSTNRAAVRHSNRTVVTRRAIGGNRVYYGGGGYYGGYHPYYYGGPSVSIGIGGAYGYPGYYGYGAYPYGYAYGAYPYAYSYDDGYPVATRTTTTYTTTRSGYNDLAYNDNLVVAVQQRLAQAGYYHGSIDAVAGPATRSAIARWQADHGMTADGRIDERTLQAMRIG